MSVNDKFVLRVIGHGICWPIAACPGQLLVFDPANATHTLTVLDAACGAVVRHRALTVPDVEGRTRVAQMITDGVLAFVSTRDRAVFARRLRLPA